MVAVTLQDQLCGRDPTLTDELTTILHELTQLSKTEHSKVALRARQVSQHHAVPSHSYPYPCPPCSQLLSPRQVLIASHMPSYELRHNQVESIFISAIDMYGHEYCPENLKVGNCVFFQREFGWLWGGGLAVGGLVLKTVKNHSKPCCSGCVEQRRGCTPVLPVPISMLHLAGNRCGDLCLALVVPHGGMDVPWHPSDQSCTAPH